MKRAALIAALSLLSASCGNTGSEADTGGLTADEARALDAAAQMLEQRRLSPEDLRTDPLPEDERPEDSAGGQ